MPNAHKIKDKGFDKHPENINKNGRPKLVVNALADMVQRDFNLKLTKGDKFQIIESLLEKSKEELQIVIDDNTSPVFMVSIAIAIIGDMQAKRINTVESIFDRVFGRAKQTHALDGDSKISFTMKFDG